MALTLDAVRSLIFRQLAPTIRAVRLMVSRGVIRRVTDTARLQLVQLSLLGDGAGDEEVADEVEHLQPFGLSFVPPVESEVVALSVGGERDHLFALGASSRAHRPTKRTVSSPSSGGGDPSAMHPGEGGLYTLDGSWRVFLDAAGNVFLGTDDRDLVFPVALAHKVEAELDKIRAALAAAQAPPGTSGGPLEYAPPTAEYTVVGSVGSEKVKAVE